MSDVTELELPSQEDVRADLRSMFLGAIRMTLETFLEEEIRELVGTYRWARLGRKDYRNGTYMRGLLTSMGHLEVAVPRSGLSEPKLGRSNPRICGIREDLVLVDLDARDPRARADALAALRCHGGVSPNETDVLRAKALLAAAEGGAQSTATLKTILASLTGRPGLARGDLGLVQLLLAQRLASDRQSPRQMAALARESAKNLAATHFGREQVLASALLASTMTGGSRFE